MGVEVAKVTHWWVARTALMRLAGATHQPIFHPVTLKVLPMLLTVKVRSHMPGRLARWMCWCWS